MIQSKDPINFILNEGTTRQTNEIYDNIITLNISSIRFPFHPKIGCSI